MPENHTPHPDEASFSDISGLITDTQLGAEHLDPTLEDRLNDMAARVASIKARYPLEEAGGNSFYDVTGNLEGLALANLRYCREFKMPEGIDPEEKAEFEVDFKQAHEWASQSVESLEAYLAAVQSDPAILEAEIKVRDGAFPALRQEADREQTQNGIAAIPYYVSRLAAEVPTRNNYANN